MQISKKSKILIAITVITILLLTIIAAVIIINQNNNRQIQENTPKENDTEQIVSTPITVSIPQIDKEESENEYSELVVNEVNTGILIRDLDRFTITVLDQEYCPDMDLNLIRGFYDLELSGHPNFDRKYLSFEVANRLMIGDAKFQEIQERIKADPSDTQVFKSYCTGSGGSAVIDSEVVYNTSFGEVNAKISVGGYQYVPNINEALSFTSNIIQQDENNIIKVGYLIKDINLVKFSDVNGIEACNNNGNLEDINCIASNLKNDVEDLDKLIQASKLEIEGLILKK